MIDNRRSSPTTTIIDVYRFVGHTAVFASIGTSIVSFQLMSMFKVRDVWSWQEWRSLLFDTKFEAILIPFLITFTIYNYDRLEEPTDSDMISEPDRTRVMKQYHHSLEIITLLAFLSSLWLSLHAGYHLTFWLLIGNCLFGVMYTSPKPLAVFVDMLLNFSDQKFGSVLLSFRLKSIPYFKTISVPLCWATTVLCTIEYAHVDLHYFRNCLIACFSFMYMYLHLFAWVNINDARDIKADKNAHVHTLAVALGFDRTITLVHTINLLLVLSLVIGIYVGILPVVGVLLVGNCLYSEVYIYMKFYAKMEAKK